MTRSKFIPKPKQIDYTDAHWAPVINCVVKYKDKVLIVQRSSDLNFYPNYWNGVSGFLDNKQSIEEKVKEELKEELGISSDKIEKIHLGDIFHQEAPEYSKTWIVHPILVEVSTNEMVFDWEAQNHKWIDAKEASNFQLLPGFDTVLEKLFSIKLN